MISVNLPLLLLLPFEVESGAGIDGCSTFGSDFLDEEPVWPENDDNSFKNSCFKNQTFIGLELLLD